MLVIAFLEEFGGITRLDIGVASLFLVLTTYSVFKSTIVLLGTTGSLDLDRSELTTELKLLFGF